LANILKIDVKEIPFQKVMHMFFMVQQIFTDQVADFTFKYIINPKAMILSEDERDLKHKLKMIKKPVGE